MQDIGQNAGKRKLFQQKSAAAAMQPLRYFVCSIFNIGKAAGVAASPIANPVSIFVPLTNLLRQDVGDSSWRFVVMSCGDSIGRIAAEKCRHLAIKQGKEARMARKRQRRQKGGGDRAEWGHSGGRIGGRFPAILWWKNNLSGMQGGRRNLLFQGNFSLIFGLFHTTVGSIPPMWLMTLKEWLEKCL